MKLVVYTALFTDDINYIHGELPEYDSNIDIEFICFTNTPYLKSNTWNIKLVDLEGGGRITARKYKTLPHDYLPDYDGWIWMDNSCLFKYDPVDLFNYYMKNSDICLHEHCDRKTIKQEAQVLIERNLDDINVINNQIDYYEKQGYIDQGLFETGILMRRNNKKVIKFNILRRNELNKRSVRDQLSFSYIKWKCSEVKINGIKETFVAHNHILGKKQSDHFYTIPRYKVKIG